MRSENGGFILLGMCSRFELNVVPADLEARFGLTAPPDEDAATRAVLDGLPRAEVRPTDRVPVIGPRRVPIALPWGFAVEWDTKPLINARAESLTEKPTFRPFVGNRCLVPMTAFFEWSGATGRGRKQRHRSARTDAPVWAMAGLVNDAGRFAVITRAATAAMADLHHRMPAFLTGPEAEAAWLDPTVPFDDVRGCLLAWDDALEITQPADAAHGPNRPAASPDLFTNGP
ncbi:SOS response-associated peptidase [Roseospira marina]|uniref:Abasic site processing protein n=1 Tax=Roseospira marina TaxID=140057 RepID=A0A5M6IIE2_9PROT|nr:SOS response-associated peptidase family protein [Roseospira marina]KAA5607455.1 SOS response-associated peptidase [Roseospira marina]MBB4312365.1 putative SOS response-associated peptidase YedK [Roseospira marina]MBB5085619.1 putative SOS response-associated peptidase YedK [Roseospira marina]